MSITKTTQVTKGADIQRGWHHIDVAGKNLGRTSTEIAQYLMGKSKSYFVRNLDCGDYVVVTNAQDVAVTGKKEEKKEYFRYSGYPNGLSSETLGKLRMRRPEEIIRRSVRGMLPQNKLRDRMLKRLFVYAGSEHPYQEKLKNKN